MNALQLWAHRVRCDAFDPLDMPGRREYPLFIGTCLGGRWDEMRNLYRPDPRGAWPDTGYDWAGIRPTWGAR